MAWEEMITAACYDYGQKGIAVIEKTPEPMKPIGRPNSYGQFMACFTKKAQPDYKGTLRGGKAIVFEAKHTDSDRIARSVISEEQEKQLNRHSRLGAVCFVLLSFGTDEYFRVPWALFRDMQDYVHRKYLMPDDIREYQIRYSMGTLLFLEGLEGGAK